MSGPRVERSERRALEAGTHGNPHRLLGPHFVGGRRIVRAFHPAAESVELLPEGGRPLAMEREGEGGLFATEGPAGAYRLRWHFLEGVVVERADPYAFTPTLGELDLHLMAEGRHRRLWERLGARRLVHEGVEGVAFSTWAPNAEAVALTGDLTGWESRALPMRHLGDSGIWELFLPGLDDGERYKFAIRTREGRELLKADPWAGSAERPPATASRVFTSTHEWSDGAWLDARVGRQLSREPLAIYEVHLGSWRRVPEEGNRLLTYRELAPLLAAHVKRLGFTHVELLPVMEHPFDGSWGYQVSGYHAPTSRHGDPDDFRAFIDELHREGIGVVLDWVPAHFVKDEFALARYDGTALFEHEHPHRGWHPDWDTAIFNFGRNEVRNFLVANALYWIEEFHVDGLRVDAVASMLYLDYSREVGEWTPNEHGGNENFEAVDFLRELNSVVHAEHPGVLVVAEESTAWPGVTTSVHDGGLGFDLKWNLGWMHDTLAYFGRDPVHRVHHHDQLTFAMLYEHHERFLNPLSHDEVVHGKGSLLARMPGDEGERFANLRALFAYQWTRPGKVLSFMGNELASPHEWRHDESLPWHLAQEPARAGLLRFLERLGALYRERPAFWQRDAEPSGFAWIDCLDREHSVIAFERRSDSDHAVVVLNLTPVSRRAYRFGAPVEGRYLVALDSDAAEFGGRGQGGKESLETEPLAWHHRKQSFVLDLPPLSALVLVPA